MIISYDGTTNDDDALALGRLLARGGARPALAYVRHSREFDPERERIAQHDAEARLLHGTDYLDDETIPRHVVFAGSTGEGLIQLAETEGAGLVVFGSDYRTPPGRAEPGTTAQRLLDGGPVAVAVAAAGLRAHEDSVISSIAVFASQDDASPGQTAEALAEKLGASVVSSNGARAELTVVGSPSSWGAGRTGLSGLSRSQLNTVLGSVLIVPYGQFVAL